MRHEDSGKSLYGGDFVAAKIEQFKFGKTNMRDLFHQLLSLIPP